jgi:hypothetical protein
MSTPPSLDSAAVREQASRAQLVEELERRIVEVDALDDSEIGSFNRWDWVICVVGAVIIPALAMWWFAP